nr:unnamed protein product [Callosobruchus analis]
MPYDICEDEAALDYIENEMAKNGITQEIIDTKRGDTERRMLEDLKRIYGAGGDLEYYDSQGATPLHIAAANGYISVVEFLLECGVRTDVRDKDDWQPSHAAACWGHLEVLELLAHAGANLNAKNKHDETPSDICEDPEIKERILELRTEQEIKRQAEAKRKVRRSQSNTRTQSVRRTSLRDKGLTARRDAVEEARLRMQAESSGLEAADTNSSLTARIPNNNGSTNQSELSPSISPNRPSDIAIPSDLNPVQIIEDRRAPEGKDHDSDLDSPSQVS